MSQRKSPSTSKGAVAIRPLGVEEALIYVMVMTAAADRVVSDAELTQIGLMVRRLAMFEGFEQDRLVEITRACAQTLVEERGQERALAMVDKALAPGQRETAYAYAVEVAAIDKTVNIEEVGLLEVLAERFEIDDLVAAAMKRSAEARYRRV